VMYIADTESHVIRAVDLEGEDGVTILAGTAGMSGDVDDIGADARFNFPVGLALDGNTLFVADANNHKVRAIDVTTGAVTTFAGTGEPTCEVSGAIATPSLCEEQYLAGDGGPAEDATLYRPFGVDLDLEGNLVVADTYNHRFRIIYR
jgi:DNA-binding beta-propeller fold protein YncE